MNAKKFARMVAKRRALAEIDAAAQALRDAEQGSVPTELVPKPDPRKLIQDAEIEMDRRNRMKQEMTADYEMSLYPEEYWRILNDGTGPRIVGSPQGNVLVGGIEDAAAAQKVCNAHNSAIDRMRAEIVRLRLTTKQKG